MLKKLLKYDFKALFKYWWIVALASAGLGGLSGVCITLIRAERDLPKVVTVSSWIVVVLAVMGIGVFITFSTVMLFIRFYKNLFTDEGYLTFTLPIKRSTVLNSKLISGVCYNFITMLVAFADAMLMLGIGFSDKIFKKEFFEKLETIVKEIYELWDVYTFVYIFEALLIIVASVLLGISFLYVCVTLASIVTRKARVITSIGIYYALNSVFSFVVQMLLMFGMEPLTEKIDTLSEAAVNPMVALLLLCVVMFMVLLCGVMYVAQYYMIDRKLNLI